MGDVIFEGVNKVFQKDVQAVSDLNLEVKDGEFLVLVGPSGCGKSTTLRMVAGLEEVTSGTISLDNRIINDKRPNERDIAMVFQNYALYPHMTVEQNMAFALKLRKVPKKERDARVREAAGLLGIGELLQRRPKELSGGQRQRVAVGRAIVRNPKVFLFDEPLSNLDAKLRVVMRAELKSLHQKLKTTTIYVTHDQEEAMTLGSRVVVMNNGLVHQCDTPLQVYRYPSDRFVAGFVGTPPMNFLTGTLVSENSSLYFNEGSARIKLPERFKERLAGRAGKKAILGIRPEAMGTRCEGRFSEKENSFQAGIKVIEPLGDKMDLYLETERHSNLVARVEARQDLSAGEKIKIFVCPEMLHVFEPGENGLNISLPQND